MAYSALGDITNLIGEERIIELTDDDNTGASNQTIIDDAISAADDLIDGYLRSRYTLPLAAVPVLIKRISIDIAVYNLYKRRAEDGLPETREKDYRDALKLLDRIQAGKINLGIEPSGSTEGGFRTNKTSDDRIFSSDELDKMP